ncbi:Gamma-soluble NSF attachment protein [Plasmodiophora brassicae]|uniref:Gamma-soluble NSF attachment protein n=1 Tax=Plasmodiophora brassicae TaxID=37360 RepID=A0A0G4ILV9_PLABS|nr:hypothetical protein PBRA_004770 [Plasmodiophora brassicae]SPQ93374.1 unnamed protein product [Plasmodiophora brassicae]
MSAIAEGEALLKRAEKAHTKTLLKWTPDWPEAARLYEEAANQFKKDASPRALTLQVTALKGAAFASEQTANINAAAKFLATAAAAVIKASDRKQAADLTRAAAKLYHENGQPRKAAEELAKAAGWVRDDNPDAAFALYDEACDIYDVENQAQMAGDTYRTAVAFLAKQGRLGDALKLLSKQNTGLLKHLDKFQEAYNKNCLNIVVLHLAVRNTSAAIKAVEQFRSSSPNFIDSYENTAVQKLIEAFERCDEELLTKAKADRTLSYIDNQIQIVVRDTLTIDDDAREAAKKLNRAAPSALGKEEELDLT